ncbi:hypothetical protein VCHA35O137_30187 [Vibrio chagasii]|nr:hypothetical protein VCHA35O137_30187 [Vibrio chagasii]CAH7074539.1 hypothetical protein VCHA52P454_10703 [Vibrio chagasii]CAH7444328.1 hypothetical protein VCHA48O429_30191 [Vibrio chagasii]
MNEKGSKLNKLERSMINEAISKGSMHEVRKLHDFTRKNFRDYCSKNPDFDEEFKDAMLVGHDARELRLEMSAKKTLDEFINIEIDKGKGESQVSASSDSYIISSILLWPILKGMTHFECKEWVTAELAGDERDMKEIMDLVEQ